MLTLRDRFQSRERSPGGPSNFSRFRFTLTLVACTLVVLSTISLWWAERQLSGPIREWARLRATTQATSAINTALQDVLADRLTELEPFRLREGGDRDVPLVSYNIGPLNRVISEASRAIVRQFENERLEVFRIPLGEVTGLHLLAGWGPTLPARIHTSGGVQIDPKIDFRSVGINQVMHRLYLDVTIRMIVIAPFLKDTIVIRQTVMLTDELIPGEVPRTYVGLEGFSGRFEDWLGLLGAMEEAWESRPE